ncbi:MAG TPA: aldo/keto reductase, partial [Chloroflexota bacterium]|nr:aldo/keto reductase [Chloroflexota bacterium]
LDEDVAVQTVWAAIEAGVSLIDTAPLYQHFASERLVGRALRERPDLAAKVTVETKVGHLPEPFDFSYDMAMTCIEGSFERLGLPTLPLVYIHDAPASAFDQVMAPDGILAALRKLQGQGLVGHIGIATNNPDQNAVYIESGEFEMAVVPEALSLLNLRITERILPAAEKFGTGLVIATPLEKGLLATGPKGWTNHPRRNFSPEVLAQVGTMEEVCARHRVSLAAAALQFLTRHTAVAASIPGANVPSEAQANARAAREVIPDALWEELMPLVVTWSRDAMGTEWVLTFN